jgi:uncharacterized protein (DUF488 family)
MVDDPTPALLTVGHSTRPLNELVALLREQGVQRLVDVRTVPRSRRNSQFDRDTLAAALPAAGIDYTPMPALGGLRRPRPDSPNGAWQNASFRGYADYMQTPEFATALAELLALAGRERIAIMCAEAVPWRCHRSLIADALTARGVPVAHIVGHGAARPHRVTPWARIEGERVTYPPDQSTDAETRSARA